MINQTKHFSPCESSLLRATQDLLLSSAREAYRIDNFVLGERPKGGRKSDCRVRVAQCEKHRGVAESQSLQCGERLIATRRTQMQLDVVVESNVHVRINRPGTSRRTVNIARARASRPVNFSRVRKTRVRKCNLISHAQSRVESYGRMRVPSVGAKGVREGFSVHGMPDESRVSFLRPPRIEARGTIAVPMRGDRFGFAPRASALRLGRLEAERILESRAETTRGKVYSRIGFSEQLTVGQVATNCPARWHSRSFIGGTRHTCREWTKANYPALSGTYPRA